MCPPALRGPLHDFANVVDGAGWGGAYGPTPSPSSYCSANKLGAHLPRVVRIHTLPSGRYRRSIKLPQTLIRSLCQGSKHPSKESSYQFPRLFEVERADVGFEEGRLDFIVVHEVGTLRFGGEETVVPVEVTGEMGEGRVGDEEGAELLCTGGGRGWGEVRRVGQCRGDVKEGVKGGRSKGQSAKLGQGCAKVLTERCPTTRAGNRKSMRRVT